MLAAVLLAGAALGVWRASADAEDEMSAAMTLAQALQQISQASALPDEDVVNRLREAGASKGLRHLRLSLRDQNGRELLRSRSEEASEPWIGVMLSWLPRWRPVNDPAPLAWEIPRAGGQPWVVLLSATPDSERREALQNLQQQLLLWLTGAGLLLLLLRWQVLKALRQLQHLLDAIQRWRTGQQGAMASVPPLQTRELQAVADALGDLEKSLHAADLEQRALSRKLDSLREDERTRLARELHDEFGQHLTAMRLDATVLHRSLMSQAQAQAQAQDAAVACGLAEQIGRLQQSLRGTLSQLAPRPASPSGVDSHAPWLIGALHDLARGWTQRAEPRLVVDVQAELPDQLPEDLAMSLFRLSQEALTNVARHASATQARVQLSVADGQLQWRVEDDGCGMADVDEAFRRGSGLAGMRERVWAWGGELTLEPASPPRSRRGLRVAASFPLTSPAKP